jgi:flagellar biosynthesis protein
MKRDKPKKAVALGYKPTSDNAPKVLAAGKGKIAEKIISTAKEHGIPLQEDSDMVEVLSKLDINEEIPPDLYQAVAEILSFVYRLNKDSKPSAT